MLSTARTLLSQPEKLDCIIEIIKPEGSRATRLSNNLIVLPGNYAFFTGCFQYRITKMWNSLPNCIQCITNKEEFQSLILSRILNERNDTSYRY